MIPTPEESNLLAISRKTEPYEESSNLKSFGITLNLKALNLVICFDWD